MNKEKEIALANLKKAQPKSSKRKDYIYLRDDSARQVRKEYYKALELSSSEVIEAEEIIAAKGFVTWRAFCRDLLRAKLLPDEVSRQSFIQGLEAAQAMPKGDRSPDATKEEKAIHRKRQAVLSRVRRTAELLIEGWPECAPDYDQIANDYIEAHKDEEGFKEFWAAAREKRQGWTAFFTVDSWRPWPRLDFGYSIP